MNTPNLDPKDRANRKGTRVWRTIFVVLFALYLSRAILVNRDDFIAYYSAGGRALQGISPFQPEETPYRYLPFTAYFFVPFSFFSLPVARVLFFILNFVATMAIYAGLRKRVGDKATILLGLLFFRFHNHDFGSAQINPILVLLFFSWWNTREKNLAFSSLAFSVFGSFKLLPFVLGLPLLVRGRWREISWIGIWTVVLNFLPVFFYQDRPLVFRDWYEQAKHISDPAMLQNIQSFQSALWWILEGHLTPKTFAFLIRGIQGALLLSLLALAPKRNRESWMVAGTLALTVLCAPLAWKHTYLLFLPLVSLWFLEDPKFVERRTRLLYGISLVGMVIAPTLVAMWNVGFSDRLYFTPWTGVIVLLLGPYLARKAESKNPA